MPTWLLRSDFLCRAVQFFFLRRAALALPLLAGACTGPAQPADPPVCTVTRQAVLPMDLRNGEVIVPGRIDDVPVSLILDTGSEGGMLTQRGAERLRLQTDTHGMATIVGTGGTIMARQVLVRGLQVAGNAFPPQVMPVVSLSRLGEDSRPADGLIGAEVLSFFDIDFDFPHRRVTLYDVRGCHGNFLPWTTAYTAVPLQRTRGSLLVLPVMLEGHRMRALLDTGSNNGRVNRAAALDMGIPAATLDHDARGQEIGVGGKVQPSAVHRFAEVQVGAERFRNVELPIAEQPVQQADMLLGLSYMLGRHIWLSYATRQMFVERRDAAVARQ